jgi:hypothetical protein
MQAFFILGKLFSLLLFLSLFISSNVFQFYPWENFFQGEYRT